MKEARTFTKFANALCILTGACCLMCIVMIIWGAVTPSGYPPIEQRQLRRKLSNLSVGTLIYASDYDGRLPSAVWMPTLRAQVHPYVESADSWLGVENYSTAPEFNFNLSCVIARSNYAIKYADTGQPIEDNRAVMYYSTITAPGNLKYMVTYTDGMVHPIPENDKFDLAAELQTRYDRKNGVLSPFSLGIDRDPLNQERKK